VISMTLAGGLAPLVWGGAPLAAGLLSGVSACLITIIILWLLRAATLGLTTLEKTTTLPSGVQDASGPRAGQSPPG
jgi:hypothetical protein